MAYPVADSYNAGFGIVIRGGRHSATISGSFVSGTAGEVSLAGSFPAIGGHEVSLAISSGTLPPGVTLDPIGKRLVYDGTAGTTAVNVGITSTPDAPSLTVSGSGASLPLMAGICFAKGAVTAAGLGCSHANLHVQIRRLWNNGSVKHAVVMGHANAGDRITFNTEPTGGTNLAHADIVASAPTAVVTLSGIGTASLATLLASDPLRTWLATPGMIECHYRTAVGAGVDVEFRVRRYNSGTVWVQALVEFSKVYGPYPVDGEQVALTGTVVIDGMTVHSYSATPLYVNTSHIHERWIGTTQYTHCVHNDMVQLQRAKIVPNYGYVGAIAEVDLAAIAADPVNTYQIGSQGAWKTDFGGGGSWPSLGILPRWDAHYICSGDDRAFKALVAQTKALHNYPIVWRHQGRTVIPSDFPDGFAFIGSFDGSAGPLRWESAHHPSAGYTLYCVTGDALYADVMEGQLAALYNTQSYAYGYGYGTSRKYGGRQVRSTAWLMRTLGQAASILPDDSVHTADYKAWFATQVDYFRLMSVDSPGATNSELGYVYAESNFESAEPATLKQQSAAWQHDFWEMSMGHVSDLEPVASANMANLVRLRDWMYRGIVGRMGTPSGYPFEYAMQFPLTVSPNVVNDFVHQTAENLYMTWADVRLNTMWIDRTYFDAQDGTMVSAMPMNNTLNGWGLAGSVATDSPYSYWNVALCALAYAVEHGAPGAVEALARLRGATNWTTVENANFSPSPIWGIKTRTSLATAAKALSLTVSASVPAGRPSWRTAMAANTWRTIPSSNLMSDLNPANNPLINPDYPGSPEWMGTEGQSAVMADWCGACYDRAMDVFHIPLSGGHNGYGGNEPYKVVIGADAPLWIMQRPPTGAIGNLINTHSSPDSEYMYADGRPKAVHNYNTPVYVPGRGPVLAIHGTATAYNAAGNSSRPILVNETTGEATFFANNPFINLTAGGERGGSCYDPTRDVIYYLQNVGNSPRLTKFAFATNTWSQIGASFSALSSNSACYLPADDCILVYCTSFASGIGVFDCATETWTFPSVSGTFIGSADLMNTAYAALAPTWVPSLNAAASWDNASNTTVINLLNKPANPRTGTWTVTQLPVSGSNATTPTTRCPAGTYGRFQYSENLNGFVLVNRYNEPLYFYALD